MCIERELFEDVANIFAVAVDVVFEVLGNMRRVFGELPEIVWRDVVEANARCLFENRVDIDLAMILVVLFEDVWLAVCKNGVEAL